MTEDSDVGRRDQVWDAVMRCLAESPASIKYGDVETFLDAEVSERTIHRVMGAMKELGWLEKERPRGHYWYPGPKANNYLNLYEPGDGRPNDGTEPGGETDETAELTTIAASVESDDNIRRADDVQDESDDVQDDDESGADVDVELDDDELPDFELDADVEARIDDAVAQVDPPGSGPIEDERREVVRRVLRHIVEKGEARPGDLQQTYYEALPVGYSSARSWWKNFVYKCLRDVDFVDTGGEGSPTWFYEPGT